MNYRELATPQGVIEYTVRQEAVTVTGYRGKDIRLLVPEQIEDVPVTGIGKKAFLSVKTLREISLPYTVRQLDDFAFAYCSALKSITLSKRLKEIGTAVFKECAALQEMHVLTDAAADEKQERDFAYLLAATVGILDAFYLFRPDKVYEKDWLDLWDKRMMNTMRVDDMEGYSKMLLCGEEDYGSDENQPDVYKSKRIKGKVRLAMLRLMHDYALSEENRSFLTAYLREYKKGSASEETWQVVLQEHGDEKEYYDLLMELGCVDHENLQEMLKDMGEQHAEMKAYLMNAMERTGKENDFFDALDL